jgi:hypothetical protein
MKTATIIFIVAGSAAILYVLGRNVATGVGGAISQGITDVETAGSGLWDAFKTGFMTSAVPGGGVDDSNGSTNPAYSEFD